MSVEPAKEPLSIGIEDDRLVIRIGVECLCRSIEMADTWPSKNEDGDPCKIVDQAQFLKDLVGELELDDEQGATSIHLMLDQAALGVAEGGSEAVEFPDY